MLASNVPVFFVLFNILGYKICHIRRRSNPIATHTDMRVFCE
jgi:hypothetical protein